MGFSFDMKKLIQVIGAVSLILLFACGERRHTAVASASPASEMATTRDSLDSLSLVILRYLKMHDIGNFVGGPAQAFKDSIPFPTTWPSFGWEDASICRIYYDYENTDLHVAIHVMDSPYQFNLDTMKMLDQSPEKMLQYNISWICVSRRNKCLIETGR